MNKKYKYLAKNTIILTVGNFSSKILSFLLVPLYTAVLSTDEVGTYDLIVSTIQVFVPLLTINITAGVMRYLLDDTVEPQEVASIGCKYIKLGILIAGFICLVNFFFLRLPYVTGNELFIFTFYALNVIYQYLIQYAKGKDRVKDMTIAGVIGTFTIVISNVILLVALNYGIKGFYISAILGQLLPVIFLYSQDTGSIVYGSVANKLLDKEMRTYSFPLVFSTIAWWINNTFDKYIVTWICGVAANGLLSVAYKIPTIITMLHSIFVEAWQISAIKEYETEDNNNFIIEVYALLNTVLCLSCSLLLIFDKIIARFMFSKDFFIAWKYTPLLLLSCVFSSNAGFVGAILAARKDSKTMANSAVIGSLTNIVLNILLGIKFGIQGVTFATAISSLSIYFVRLYRVKEIFTNHIIRKSVLSWSILLVQAMLIIVPNGNLYIFNIACFICILVLYNDSLVRIFKNATRLRGKDRI